MEVKEGVIRRYNERDLDFVRNDKNEFKRLKKRICN